MLTLLACRVDRSQMLLVNSRLDGYPAYFHIEPAALADFLRVDSIPDLPACLTENWPALAPTLTRLVRRFGNDFTVTSALLGC
ncbi:hypothetical protein [Craterilacuibacter sp.]|uniref:hypothetical protein n=1 Tax=Craterilacuibacter sp. TaxID=2870909 RepID=UPI003F3B0E3F